MRTLQTSSALNDYVNWPGVQQVFRLDRKTTILKTDHIRMETVYGLTSLPTARAGAARLLKVTRGQWTIENRSHWIRDVLFGEDESQLRARRLPHIHLRHCRRLVAEWRLWESPMAASAVCWSGLVVWGYLPVAPDA